MKVLVVANYNRGSVSPFVQDQIDALRSKGCEVSLFGVVGKGIKGYLSNWSQLKKAISESGPDVIHAHYGFCGLLANLQRRVPVVTTYHGSDIHSLGLNLKISKFALKLSAFNIFVSADLKRIASFSKDNFDIIPCGVDTTLFNTKSCRRNSSKVLFASSLNNQVKNPQLALAAISKLDGVELVELKGLTRAQVAEMIRGVGALLMTSHREGSPQIIKEALASGTPIVSVNVGDVMWQTEGVDGCYIAEANADDIADKLSKALSFNGDTKGYEKIISLGLDNRQIASKLIDIYKKVKRV